MEDTSEIKALKGLRDMGMLTQVGIDHLDYLIKDNEKGGDE